MFLDAIKRYLEKFGIHGLTLKKVQQFIQSEHPELKALHCKTISDILKKRFHLNYKKMNSAHFRYKDPVFNEKRLWVCRLLTQFLLDGAVIVSVDESHIRSDSLNQFSWRFDPKVRDIFTRLQQLR